MNQQQQNDYSLFKSVAPTLTQERFLELDITLYDWDRRTSESLLHRLKRGERDFHLRTYLKCENKKSWRAGRCWNKGTEDWSRVDGGPLTQEDIDAVNSLSYGQLTYTANVPGDMVAHVKWECDSSD